MTKPFEQQPTSKRVASEEIWVRVTPDLKLWAEGQARADGRTLSRWVARLIEAARQANPQD